MNTETQHTESGNSPPAEVLEAQIREAVLVHRRADVEHARTVGTLLIQLKATIEHGDWLPALKRCKVPVRRAQVYMRLARKCVAATYLDSAPTIRDTEAAFATSKLTERVGNPSIRPLPVDTRSDEEREADEKPNYLNNAPIEVTLDPLNPLSPDNLGHLRFLERKLAEASALITATLEVAEPLSGVELFRALVILQNSALDTQNTAWELKTSIQRLLGQALIAEENRDKFVTVSEPKPPKPKGGKPKSATPTLDAVKESETKTIKVRISEPAVEPVVEVANREVVVPGFGVVVQPLKKGERSMPSPARERGRAAIYADAMAREALKPKGKRGRPKGSKNKPREVQS
jgi:hypothetical protein